MSTPRAIPARGAGGGTVSRDTLTGGGAAPLAVGSLQPSNMLHLMQRLSQDAHRSAVQYRWGFQDRWTTATAVTNPATGTFTLTPTLSGTGSDAPGGSGSSAGHGMSEGEWEGGRRSAASPSSSAPSLSITSKSAAAGGGPGVPGTTTIPIVNIRGLTIPMAMDEDGGGGTPLASAGTDVDSMPTTAFRLARTTTDGVYSPSPLNAAAAMNAPPGLARVGNLSLGATLDGGGGSPSAGGGMRQASPVTMPRTDSSFGVTTVERQAPSPSPVTAVAAAAAAAAAARYEFGIRCVMPMSLPVDAVAEDGRAGSSGDSPATRPALRCSGGGPEVDEDGAPVTRTVLQTLFVRVNTLDQLRDWRWAFQRAVTLHVHGQLEARRGSGPGLGGGVGGTGGGGGMLTVAGSREWSGSGNTGAPLAPPTLPTPGRVPSLRQVAPDTGSDTSSTGAPGTPIPGRDVGGVGPPSRNASTTAGGGIGLGLVIGSMPTRMGVGWSNWARGGGEGEEGVTQRAGKVGVPLPSWGGGVGFDERSSSVHPVRGHLPVVQDDDGDGGDVGFRSRLGGMRVSTDRLHRRRGAPGGGSSDAGDDTHSSDDDEGCVQVVHGGGRGHHVRRAPSPASSTTTTTSEDGTGQGEPDGDGIFGAMDVVDTSAHDGASKVAPGPTPAPGVGPATPPQPTLLTAHPAASSPSASHIGPAPAADAAAAPPVPAPSPGVYMAPHRRFGTGRTWAPAPPPPPDEDTLPVSSAPLTASASGGVDSGARPTPTWYGHFSCIGSRPTMEDAHVLLEHLEAAVPSGVAGSSVAATTRSHYFAVFDGHGGASVANAAAAQLHLHLAAAPTFSSDLEAAVHHAFATTEAAVLARLDADVAAGIKSRSHGAGSTALVAVMRDRTLTIGSLGDCRAVLCTGGTVGKALNEEHTPQSEAARIEGVGGWLRVETNLDTVDLRNLSRLPVMLRERVNKCPTRVSKVHRICGELAVSRALGDAVFKGERWRWHEWEWPGHHPTRAFSGDLVSATPQVRTIHLSPEDRFMVIACDGLWDVLSTEEVVLHASQYLAEGDSPAIVTQKLVRHAMDVGSTDNITAIVVLLNEGASDGGVDKAGSGVMM